MADWGDVYVADSDNCIVWRVAPSGRVFRFAGNGDCSSSGEGVPARRAGLDSYFSFRVEAAPDGSVYIAEYNKVRKVSPSGIITTVAGGGDSEDDGIPATEAFLEIDSIAIGEDGSLYIGTSDGRIRMVDNDGVITTVAGTGEWDYNGDGIPGPLCNIDEIQHMQVGPDGAVYFSELARLRRLKKPFGGYADSEIGVASEDGSELYVFSRRGRHLRTLDGLTGLVLWSFEYDDEGRLSAVVDRFGNRTEIEHRDAEGRVIIHSPFGPETVLELNSEGLAERITGPEGDTWSFSYDSGGLMTSERDPRGFEHAFAYDELGRLVRDDFPDGGGKTLERQQRANGSAVKVATALGRESWYVESLEKSGEKHYGVTHPGTEGNSLYVDIAGRQRLTFADGTIVEAESGPDPRYGMMAPVVTKQTVSAGVVPDMLIETEVTTVPEEVE
ncbi:MAG: hypothetical protein D6806_07160, partial [Deltaproteobacteria bacterium]